MTVHCTSIKDLWEKTSHLILISNLNFEYIHSQTRKLGSAMPLCLSQQSKFATNSPISFIFNFWPRDKSRFHNKTSRHKKTSRFTFEEKIHFGLGLLATDIASTKRRKRNFNSVTKSLIPFAVGGNVSVKSKLQLSPPPRAYPGHLTPLPSRGGGNLIIRVFRWVGNLIPML